MKRITVLIYILFSTIVFGQIDKQQLALDISATDALNTKKLMPFVWKRTSTATVDGEIKGTVINEIRFDSVGKIKATVIGGESSSKDKRGIRGKIQDSKKKSTMDYVEKALKLSISYIYMSKGEYLDFFEKAVISEKENIIEASGSNIYIQGDSLTVLIDAKTKLFISKKFSSTLEEDPINGDVKYELFSSGINHGSETILNLPGKKAIISAKNSDYTQLIK